MKPKMITRDQSGGATVEFALILPLFILLIFGIIEFGLVLYNKHIITNACREGVRAGIVVRIPRLGNLDIENKVLYYAEKYLVTFGADTLDNGDISILPIDTDNSFDPTVTPPIERCTSFGCDLVVDVTYNYDFLVLSAFGFGPTILHAQTTMRME